MAERPKGVHEDSDKRGDLLSATRGWIFGVTRALELPAAGKHA